MFMVVYRWRIRPGFERSFERAWAARTETLYAIRGSLGSRLCRETDSTFTAIALWPTRDAWESDEPPLPADTDDARAFEEAIERALPPLMMETIDDRWKNGAVALQPGYIDLPDGMMANVVTNLQMLAPPADRAPHLASSDALRIERVEHIALDRYRRIFREVGQPYMWFSRLRLDDGSLAAIVHDRDVEIYVATIDGNDAGFLELDFRRGNECEIVFFGFVETAIGRGYGNTLMNYAIERAWAHPIQRLWLHTCTNDHPRALPFYERFGFAPYSRQVEVHSDPYADGTLTREPD